MSHKGLIVLDLEFDELEIPANEKFNRKKKIYQPHCDCTVATRKAGRRPDTNNLKGQMYLTKSTSDGLCAYCGHYAFSKVAKER